MMASHASTPSPSGASRPTVSAALLQEVRDFGKYPKEGSEPAERRLAQRVPRARNAGKLTPEELAELDAMKETFVLMQEVRDLGRYPKDCSLSFTN